ncbi:carbohydrate-binding protein [Ereboglobus luteus]|uniref:Chitin-binding type-3 domain-containing protein n=1 Tax=Ereboglobus luteus TaxID=1796921 RepID=A0A2U8E644_9BACT|nr:carbohydrate-binding protein [Ereboglobus luteus]AWI10327.1 hypothetical protein CKA38_14635 [Ereboglobus luteus]
MKIEQPNTSQATPLTLKPDNGKVLKLLEANVYFANAFLDDAIDPKTLFTEVPTGQVPISMGSLRYQHTILKAAGVDIDKESTDTSVTPWTLGMLLLSKQKVSYGGLNYTVIQGHTTQSDWTPPLTPSLFSEMKDSDKNGAAEWKQPTGAHDAYALGTKVAHNGKTWESTVDGNTWEPGLHGWKDVS